MDFLIADTFTDSLARLTGDEQKSVKMTAFDLQLNPANPGMSFHKLDQAKDKHFWSVRATSDIRLIVHKTSSSLLLCYVDHHDKAYSWAERRKLETHPKTGAAQIVELRETVQDIVVPRYVEQEVPRKKPVQRSLFSDISDDDLLGYGVPLEWLSDVRSATEDSLLNVTDHLPGEAAEALLELATGGKPRRPVEMVEVEPAETGWASAEDAGELFYSVECESETAGTEATTNPFEHPDAQRRFLLITNAKELEQALEFPWEKWIVFLHPDQRELVERDFNGPARVSGSAGTGKTIVALHRAAYLAKSNQHGKVLLTTFSDTLANALKTKLQKLLAAEPDITDRIDVKSLDTVGSDLHSQLFGPARLASREVIGELISAASNSIPVHKFSRNFLISEWEQIFDAWQLETWEEYRDVARLGRKTRLSETQRGLLWSIFTKVRVELEERNLTTSAGMFCRVAERLRSFTTSPYECIVVDESQDLSISQLKFLAAIGRDRPKALFFAGDLGQRIFQQPFSWKALGVDIRGRSRTLCVNYRTSHQIRSQADRLLGPEVTDIDGNKENRGDTVSVFGGPAPEIQILPTEADEKAAVARWLIVRSQAGVIPHEIGIFVRSVGQLDRAQAAVKHAGLPFSILDEQVEPACDQVSICTMHLAKGLEFRSVVVMACDDEVIPLQERIEKVGDDADLQEVYDTERHLLYVACTRARDHLLVTSVEPASEFLDDLRS